MRRNLPGLITLFVSSEILGFLTGQVFFGLFEKTVPVALTTQFNRDAAHVMFVLYGLGSGLAMFLWALLAVAGARVFPRRKVEPGRLPGP
jgi:hypothetical protein